MVGLILGNIQHSEYLSIMRRVRSTALLVSIFSILSLISVPVSQADVPTPKGISSELWSVFQETVLLDLEGQKRNFRWTVSPGYFVKGNPTARDTDTLNNVLFYIASHCENIKPGKSASEPSEGVIFNFVNPSDFSKVIPTIPKDVNKSYILWSYYKDRGITKANIVISTEEQDLVYRDYLIRLRALQGLGFYSLTEKPGYKLFALSYDWERSNGLTKGDKELLALYCSTLVRAWDTGVQTQNYINEEYSKVRSSAPSFDNRVTVDGTSQTPNFVFQPFGDLIIRNGVRTVSYRVTDSSDTLIDSGEIDVSNDAFGIREITMNNLSSRKSYVLLLYPKNASGFGAPQRVNFRTGDVSNTGFTSKPSASSSNQEVIDSFNAASDAYNLVLAARKQCSDASKPVDSASRRILSLISNAKICNSEDIAIERAKSSLARLESNLGTSSNNVSLLNELNSLTDDLNMIAESMDAATVYIEDISSIGDSIIELEEKIADLSTLFESYDAILIRLPSTIQSALKRDSTLAAVEKLRNQIQDVDFDFSEFLDGLKSSTYFDLPQPDEIAESLDELDSNLPSDRQISQTISIALKKIPSFYCKKSKTTILPSKNKCLTGYTRVVISKT